MDEFPRLRLTALRRASSRASSKLSAVRARNFRARDREDRRLQFQRRRRAWNRCRRSRRRAEADLKNAAEAKPGSLGCVKPFTRRLESGSRTRGRQLCRLLLYPLSYFRWGAKVRLSPACGASEKPHQRGFGNLGYRRSSVVSSSLNRINPRRRGGQLEIPKIILMRKARQSGRY